MTDPASDESGRRERKRLQQLDHLADTAWTLFEAGGYEAVTMERIAEVADVAKGTLYKHFPVKEALLRHRFHRELRAGWPEIQSRLAVAAPGRTRLALFLDRHAAWCEGHRAYLLPYVRFRLADPQLASEGRERSGINCIFTELIAQGQAAGDFRADIPAPLMASYLQFTQLATILRWLTEDSLSLTREMERLVDLVCNGMGAQR
ncbi:MAG TPA: TetR/AcrR family transcriptional regulator [Rhodocyclaceae bacterium]|nr:TetR/AcrR family transcriptional regulator [Rhodocyclaceae bacterium]